LDRGHALCRTDSSAAARSYRFFATEHGVPWPGRHDGRSRGRETIRSVRGSKHVFVCKHCIPCRGSPVSGDGSDVPPTCLESPVIKSHHMKKPPIAYRSAKGGFVFVVSSGSGPGFEDAKRAPYGQK